MKNYKSILVIVSLIVCLAGAVMIGDHFNNERIALQRVVKATADEKVEQQKVVELKARIKAFTLARMEQVKTKLSPLRRDILSTQIAEVSAKVFQGREDHAQAFVTVLAIESAFNKNAQSMTGPRGLGQVAKAAMNEALKKCTDLSYADEDVWDVEVNLLASSCYFKTMLDMSEGNPYVAIVSYNSGGSSNDTKSFKKTGSIQGEEPLRYLARFVFLSNPKLAAGVPE